MKKITISIAVFSLLALVALPVIAAESGSVSATVTPTFVSITVTDGSVNYGSLGLSESDNTLDGTASETQTITNVGSVSTDITLSSSDAVGDSVNWDLENIPGTDIFSHSYDIDGVVESPSFTDFPADNSNTGTVATLANNGNTATLDLKIEMPTGITDVSVHNITVTVLATAT